MKLFALAAAGLVSFSVSSFAKESKLPEAKEYRVYETIKFQKDTYVSDLNLMDDGIQIPDGYTYVGYGVKFKLDANEEFTIKGEFISDSPGATGQCLYAQPVITKLKKGSQVTIDLNADSVEIDSGDKCQFTIETTTGNKAIISIYNEGT